MAWDFLKHGAEPRLPSRTRTVVAMAVVGVLTGLMSSLPSPLPVIRLEDDGLILNSPGTPLHAGAAFAAGIALCMWFWVTRDGGKCLLTFLLILVGWLAAMNTANDFYQGLIGSDLFGTRPGAKNTREAIGLLLGGVIGGAVGGGLVAFGSGIAAKPIRSPKNWILIVAVGALAGIALYPAVTLLMPLILFVPWQGLVAAMIGFGMTRAA